MNIDLTTLNMEWERFKQDSEGLRFGQYLVNCYFEGSCPELYYCEDDDVAYSIALAKIIGEA